MCKSLETFVDVQCAIACLKTCSDDRQQKSQFSCHQNFAAFSCLPVMTFVISKDLSFVDPPPNSHIFFFYAVIPSYSRVTVINTASILFFIFTYNCKTKENKRFPCARLFFGKNTLMY